MDNFEVPEFPAPQRERFDTERLLVRRTEEADRGSLIPTLSDPGLIEGFGLNGSPDPQAFIDDAADGWRGGLRFTFTIIDKADQSVIGLEIALLQARNGKGWRAEVQIAIAPDFQGQGYGPEAMSGLIGWIFHDIQCPSGVTLDEVWAACKPSNCASLKLLRKLEAVGMREVSDQQVTPPGSGQNENETTAPRVFSVLREDYERVTQGSS